MKKFYVRFTMTARVIVPVDAETEDEAEEKAEQADEGAKDDGDADRRIDSLRDRTVVFRTDHPRDQDVCAKGKTVEPPGKKDDQRCRRTDSCQSFFRNKIADDERIGKIE